MEELVMKSGTKIIDGIEYNAYPAPDFLLKAMESKWATKLISEGVIRLNSLSYYHNLESAELGDSMEGLGELQVNAHPYSTSSINEHFVWCSASPDSDCMVLLALDDSYNVVIKINDIAEFVKRIFSSLKTKKYKFSPPQIGRVTYDRSNEVTMENLKDLQWQWSSFQKSDSYSHQNEFRFVFSDLSFELEQGKSINLIIGNCSDIIEFIEI